MKFIKSIVYLIFIVYFLPIIFSIGVYESNGDFVYYSSNINPTINVNITTPFENVILSNAKLTVNNVPSDFPLNDYEILIDSNYVVTTTLSDFGITEDLESSDIVFYELLALGSSDSKKIKPSGDPTEFRIIIDDVKPRLVSPININNLLFKQDDEPLLLTFSEKISKYSIRINGEVEVIEFNSKFKIDYPKTISLDFNEGKIVEGSNEIELIYYDLGGNMNNNSFTMRVRGEELSVNLLTNKDDSSLNYFYDENYIDFLDSKVYYNKNPFTLKIQTNKEASCYIALDRSAPGVFNDVMPDADLMSSVDSLTHSFELPNGDNYVWVACSNTVFPDEIVYLSESMGLANELIVFEFYDEDYEIDYVLPIDFVTSLPFNVDVRTTDNAICQYRIDSSSDFILNSTNNYIDHFKNEVFADEGNHNLNVECFNKIGLIKTQTNTFTVDTKSGIRIISYEPKYPNSASTNINLILSENAQCKISKNPISAKSYGNETELIGDGLTRTFSTFGLESGDNFYYILCEKNGKFHGGNINLIYDPIGPKVTNIRFDNNGIESSYVSDSNEIEVLFDVESLIPIKQNFLGLELENETILKETKKEKYKFRGELESAKSIWIVAQSDANRNSTKESRNINFDFDAPLITFNQDGDEITISCFDSKSGCHETKYSLSNTALDCNPKRIYENKTKIDIGDKNYICAFSFDKAGNFAKEQKDLGFSGGGGGIFDPININNTPVFNQTDPFEDPAVDPNKDPDNEPKKDKDDPFVPITPPTNVDEGFNWLIFIALILVLGGIGGGGYYAYNKGYLDKELKKFGIVRKNANINSKTGVAGNGTNINRNQYGANQNKLSPQQEKEKYDRHLSKLNNFIDDTLNKGGDVFDKFKSVDKGKVEGYDDTLIKKDTTKKPNLSKEEFDEFYTKSKGLEAELEKNNSVEKDAEAFEDYYKDKKKSNKKD